MRYFTYSPFDYQSPEDAFRSAEPYLQDHCIVHITDHEVAIVFAGDKPRARPNTHLVRVEQDNSLRIVHTNIE